MPVQNAEVARIFEQLADLLEIEAANPFRVRAYRGAILRAMDHPHFHVLAHPTGRLIGERQPYAVDLERIVAGAAERGCFLELNAQPKRLDLPDVTLMAAKEAGVGIVVSTDAHSADQLGLMSLGVGYARRGSLTAKDVVNTLPWIAVRMLIGR